MQLEKAAAHLKPRSAYEAVDFGFLFVRKYYGRLVATGAILLIPLATILALILPDYTYAVLIAFWWLKPIWERALLFSLSRALFEEAPTIRETLSAFRSYALRDWFQSITIRRLSPTRSFDLPVTVLEGSTGSERGARLSILHRGRFPSAAMSLTVLLAHVEIALPIAIVLLLQMLIPEAVDWNILDWAFAFDGEPSLGGQFFVLYLELLVMLLVAPYYVVGGFSLYVHRRTELEAWDLELAFRRLVSRNRLIRGTGGGAVAGIAIVGLVLGLLGVGVSVDAAYAEELTQPAAKESIESILEGEEFHQPETMWVPKFILDWELDTEEAESFEWPEWLVNFTDWLRGFTGGSLQVLIASAALGVLAWLVFRIAGNRGIFGVTATGARQRRQRPTVLFGLEVTEESLPEDLVREALVIARAGRARDALALLYRGALTRLALVYGAELGIGVTERECLEAARPLLPEEGTRYFDRLTGVWLRCAYGHVDPDPGGLEALCTDWAQWFEKTSEPTATPSTPSTLSDSSTPAAGGEA